MTCEVRNKEINIQCAELLVRPLYMYQNRPDVIILNEMWLKCTMLDDEIFPSSEYKIYRCDRTEFSHPPDPNDRLKFRRNGGGVLIAIRYALQISSNYIDIKCKAEILAIELVLKDGSKVVISTCYRVGTLGTDNCREITAASTKLLRKKKLEKFFLVGDLNLRTVHWENNSCTNKTDKMFLDEFIRLGLLQCIKYPTHIKGNIVDQGCPTCGPLEELVRPFIALSSFTTADQKE